MEKFLKPSVMMSETNTLTLLKVDYEDNHMDVNKVKVGFVTERALEEHVKNLGAERLRPEFKHNCKHFLVKMVSKLFEKAPVNYTLVRSLSFLDPRMLLKNKEHSSQKLTTVL